MVTILKRDLQRLGAELREAQRQALYWRERALSLNPHHPAEEDQ